MNEKSSENMAAINNDKGANIMAGIPTGLTSRTWEDFNTVLYDGQHKNTYRVELGMLISNPLRDKWLYFLPLTR